MSYRKSMSNKSSKRVFRKGAATKKINIQPGKMGHRGGIRL